jgi:bacillithiol biosynthesis cysteine-adding enzyme BshC
MFALQHIPYHQTASFSNIVMDYLDRRKTLHSFYSHPPDLDGLKVSIVEKSRQKIDRQTLVNALNYQYKGLAIGGAVKNNISALADKNTFSICTAHQPNLFTGPLYFIYKIMHVIKLSVFLKEELPQYNFVPVYYMGSEDADFEELNHFTVQGKKYEWKTKQKGAVGRMIIDKEITDLIVELQQQIGVEPYGDEWIELLQLSFIQGETIQKATLKLVNALFGKYGLVILIAEAAELKATMKSVFYDDLFNQAPSQIVEVSCNDLANHYNVQATPRTINLFYLKDDVRERIEKVEDRFRILNSDISFTSEEMKNELDTYPERFSPNVILRGLFQETLLPNIAFLGGGGELAYWLQLKELFVHYSISFPVLILRNSFLIIEKKWNELIEKFHFTEPDLFLITDKLLENLIRQNSINEISLNGNFEKTEELFARIEQQAIAVDATLSKHVAAIKTRSLKNLEKLEKKMLRAEKRKYTDQQRQIEQMKANLFPGNGLQERVENIAGFYAKWGAGFIENLFQNSPSLEQHFTILKSKPE